MRRNATDSGPVASPTREDPLLAEVSERFGGRLGRFARGRRRWASAVAFLVLLTAATFAVGMGQKALCYADGWAADPDDDGVDDRYVQMCYSDLPPLYVPRGFAEAHWPYSDDEIVRERYPQVMEYPVGISYWAWGSGWLTHLIADVSDQDRADRAAMPAADVAGADGVDRERLVFMTVNAVGLGLLALLTVWLLAGVDRRRPWDATAFALAPTLALTGLINWDLLAVAFVAGALWAWGRGRPLLTGVMIGLGTATKLYPLFLLGGLLVLCLRRRRWADLAIASAASALSWTLAQLPAWVTGFDQWQVFWSFNADRGADLGSLWLVLDHSGAAVFSAETINIASLVFFALWCLAVLVLGLRAPSPPTLAQLGFLIVAGFLLVNKVYSPQYVLWLLPLAVLARPRWRDQLIWQGTEVFYFCCVWWYLAGQLDSGSDAPIYWLAILLRLAGELFLVAMVVRDLYRPRGVDDRVPPPPSAVARA